MPDKQDAAKVMAACVRDSLLDVARIVREGAEFFDETTGPETARSIARSIENGAKLSYEQIMAEDADAAP
ncbi:MAG: hypothetical protein WAP03_19220 [Methylorubrum rhodinum]|uniref:hypothetical protein n=1 Tax=Methylorubrum rhodinum TaxID=29428 RepID=UPI003BB0A827